MSVDGFSVTNQSHKPTPMETTFIINFSFFLFGIWKVIKAGGWLHLLCVVMAVLSSLQFCRDWRRFHLVTSWTGMCHCQLGGTVGTTCKCAATQ